MSVSLISTILPLPPKTKKALPSHARDHNRALVVRTIYTQGPQSRADLARETGLAKVTVSDVVAELIEADFLRELGTRPTKGPGKPGVILDLAWDAFLILAFDLSEHGVIRGALLTLDAVVAAEIVRDRSGATGDDALDLLMSTIRSLLEFADRPVLGIGVGTPGLVTKEGAVAFSANLGWKDVELRSLVEKQFDLPTIVMNDANLAAVGEQLYGDGANDLLLVKFGQGLGAGLILGGRLVRGSRNTVGEIGHLVVSEDAENVQSYDSSAVLEHWLAVPRLRENLTHSDPAEREERIRQSGRRLGSALAPLVSMLDLSEVVLYGPEDLLAGPLSEEAMEVIRQRTLPQTHQDLTIRLSPEGKRLVLLGCAAQVLSTFLGDTRGTPASRKPQ